MIYSRLKPNLLRTFLASGRLGSGRLQHLAQFALAPPVRKYTGWRCLLMSGGWRLRQLSLHPVGTTLLARGDGVNTVRILVSPGFRIAYEGKS